MDEHCTEFARLFGKLNWTQARVANELGVHPSVVTRYLKGTTRPSITILRLFASIIGEVVLLPGEEDQQPHSKIGPRWLQEWQEDALDVLQRIDPKSRRAFIMALRSMIDALGKVSPKTKILETDSGLGIPTVDQVLKTIVQEEASQVLAEEGTDPQQAGKRRRRGPIARQDPKADPG